jgi:hypothetical protein
MTKNVLLATIALCIFNSLSIGQGAFLGVPQPSIPEATTAVASDKTAPAAIESNDDTADYFAESAVRLPRFRVSGDYLLWWIKGQPVSTAILTLASPADAAAVANLQPVAAAAINRPNTTILFGDQSVDFHGFNGMRYSAAFAFDDERRWAMEGSFFLLEQQQSTYNVAGGANGSRVFGRPIFNNVNNTETAELDAIPGFFTGSASVTTSSQLYGWEINATYNAVRSSNLTWDFIAGFRALDLNENMTISDSLTQIAPGFLTFQGAPLPSGARISDFDSFSTTNHFWGPQLGTRFDWTFGQFHVDFSTKLAMGVTEQLVAINGSTTVVNSAGGIIGSQPGGILALPSNIGQHYHDQFTVVPEVGLNLGYRITPLIEARIGYTFLYWSSVARPGNQIDRSINTTQVPSDPSYGTAGGTNRPAANVTGSDFWAQGINFGLQFQF